MGKHNERLIGLTYTTGEVKYTVQPSFSGMAAGFVSVKNNSSGSVHSENLSSVLYHLDAYSRDSDPMLLTLDDFDFANRNFVNAQKELTQLVCDNKDFNFLDSMSEFNDVIAETNALAEKINETIKAYKMKMAEALKDNPPSITVTGNQSGSGVAVEVTGLDINETVTFQGLQYLPNHYTRETILAFVMEQVGPHTLEAFKKAGRVIVDGKELPMEDEPTLKL